MIVHTTPLTENQIAKLTALQNYATKYEIVIEIADGRKLRVAYSGRKSKTGILSAVQKIGPQIVALTSMPDDARMEWSKGAMKLGNVATIKFSGRTQRDAIMSGELAYAGAAA